MQSLYKIFSVFETVELEDNTKKNFLNRRDNKFLFHYKKLPLVLQQLQDDYRIIINEKNYVHTYQTVYYDTFDLKMYLMHHNGKLSRYKIRSRNYVNTNECFLEIKYKNNRQRTIKDRIKRTSMDFDFNEEEKKFIATKTSFTHHEINPVLQVDFSRMAFISKKNNERLTIDIQLNFCNKIKSHSLNNIVIAEIKHEKITAHATVFGNIMKQFCIRENGISKYCMGIDFLNIHSKKNNFKPKYLFLNKIFHDTSE